MTPTQMLLRMIRENDNKEIEANGSVANSVLDVVLAFQFYNQFYEATS